MKKPLILLVDDDSSVLDALEAELRPAFEELARIETFDDPLTVLASLPRWTEERRPIAVAIVDQKMPGMTGVELLVSLRQAAGIAAPETFHAARHMRAILLTGYAGLDSALAAKNEAAVDRYVEKPWPRADLHRATRRMLVIHLTLSGADRFFEVREASEAAVLRRLLRVRYEVYRDTPHLAHFFPENLQRLAVDEFDIVARFLALLSCTLVSEAVAGGLRMVDGGELWSTPALIDVAGDHVALAARMRARREEKLALLTYWPAPKLVRDFVDGLLNQRERVVEVGRLALRADSRSSESGGRRIAFLLLEGTVAFLGFAEGVANTLMTCPPPHERVYQRLGFERVPGTGAEHVPSMNEPLVCLHGSPGRVDSSVATVARAMADRLRNTGAMCRCESFPQCMPLAYTTNRFDTIDVFCPSRSRELLGAQPASDTRAARDTEFSFDE